MPQCLLTMHMIIMVHYKYWDNSMGTRRTNDSIPPPLRKNFFSQYTTVYNRPALIIYMYTILLFIHYRIMANYRIPYTVKNVFQILEANFHPEKMTLLLLHVL